MVVAQVGPGPFQVSAMSVRSGWAARPVGQYAPASQLVRTQRVMGHFSGCVDFISFAICRLSEKEVEVCGIFAPPFGEPYSGKGPT